MSYKSIRRSQPSSELQLPLEESFVTPNTCSLVIVDDEPQVLKVLSDLLSKDFEILTAETGESAKELFGRRDIDLILADQKLPGMPGVQLLEWIRQNSPRTVRLMMTGIARFED